jgi:hypothetical protein
MLVHVSHEKNCTKFHRAGQVLVCSEFILTVISSEMFGVCSQPPFTSVSHVRVAACPWEQLACVSVCLLSHVFSHAAVPCGLGGILCWQGNICLPSLLCRFSGIATLKMMHIFLKMLTPNMSNYNTLSWPTRPWPKSLWLWRWNLCRWLLLFAGIYFFWRLPYI